MRARDRHPTVLNVSDVQADAERAVTLYQTLGDDLHAGRALAVAERIEDLLRPYDAPEIEIEQVLGWTLSTIAFRHTDKRARVHGQCVSGLRALLRTAEGPAAGRALLQRVDQIMAIDPEPHIAMIWRWTGAYVYWASLGDTVERARECASRIVEIADALPSRCHVVDRNWASTLLQACRSTRDVHEGLQLIVEIAEISARHTPPNLEIDHKCVTAVHCVARLVGDRATADLLVECVTATRDSHAEPDEYLDAHVAAVERLAARLE